MASVTLEHLSKIYSNGFVSVNDVSLRVDNGEFITLHGPSGCGRRMDALLLLPDGKRRVCRH